VLSESFATVSADPRVELLVAQSPGPVGRALLVVHGGPDGDHTCLRDPLSELSGQHRLILPGLRGCGRSTRGLPSGSCTPGAAVGDLLGLLDRLGLADVDLLGFSYGGLLAQRLAVTARQLDRRGRRQERVPPSPPRVTQNQRGPAPPTWSACAAPSARTADRTTLRQLPAPGTLQ